MGYLKTTEKVWSEETIIDTLQLRFLSPSSLKYNIRNLYVFHKTWESDYLAMTKAGYLYEGEVKISRSDFKADMKKKRKHQILEGTYEPKDVNIYEKGKFVGTEPEKVLKPNYFFYAVPEGLIEPSEVPDYAGLVYMTNVFPYWKWAKKAPKIHDVKFSDQDLNLTEKFYYNMVSWRNKAMFDYKRQLDETNRLLKEAKVDENGKTYPFTTGQYKEMYEQQLAEKLERDETVTKLYGEMKALLAEDRILRRKVKELTEELVKIKEEQTK